MTLFALSLALLALLLTPGPTNTLLALAGAERGFWRALRLIPAELLGYLTVTVPLALAGEAVLESAPMLRPAVTALAALWVLWLAVALWRLPEAAGSVSVSARRVLLTTLMNPKALIIGLVLLPGPPPLWPRVALFCLLIGIVASLWALAGAQLASRTAGPGARLFRQGAAIWLALLSLGLAAKAIAG